MAKILVIDDEYEIRELLRKVLTKAGYEVFLAENGKEGINIYSEEKIDVVLCDIIMPEKEGLETIVELSHTYPDLKLVAMSGGGKINAADHLKTAKMLGAKHTLTKPFEIAQVIDSINDLLK